MRLFDMKQESSQNADFNSINILVIVYKWRKPLITAAILAVVISVIVSLTITEKYKSTAILFPGVTNSTSKALIADNAFRPDVMEFGDEDNAEQMLQILSSSQISDKICKKYKLMEHYGIDPTDKLAQTAFNNEYKGNISFERTKFMSVKIEVMDSDPILAAAIANDIATFHDSVRFNIQKERATAAHTIIKKEYLAKVDEVNKLHDSLQILNKLGIIDLKYQSKVTSQEYLKALASNDKRAMNALQQELNVLAKYGSAFVYVTETAFMARTQLNQLKIKLEEAKMDIREVLPQKFIVSSAYPAEKKSYPIRWIIVLVSTFSTLFICLLIILLVENFKNSSIKNNN